MLEALRGLEFRIWFAKARFLAAERPFFATRRRALAERPLMAERALLYEPRPLMAAMWVTDPLAAYLGPEELRFLGGFVYPYALTAFFLMG